MLPSRQTVKRMELLVWKEACFALTKNISKNKIVKFW